jgi:hypothetical protein
MGREEMLLPDYVEFFVACYTPEFVENIVKLESSLAAIHYDKHQDLIDNIFLQEGTMEMRALCDEAITVYRTHIADALYMQGFSIMNVEEHSLAILANIVMGVSVLAKTDVLTITEGVLLPEAESDLEWVCNLLEITSTIPATELLFYIADVNEYIVDLLKAGESTEEYRVANNKRFQQRFLEIAGADRTGAVISVIRDMSYFGYNPHSVLEQVAHSLEELTDIKDIRKELLYLIAGSNLNTVESIQQFLDEAVNSLYQNTQMILKLNSQWPDFESWIK